MKKFFKYAFLLALLALVLSVLFAFRVPQKVGLVPSPAKKVLATTPDYSAAEQLSSDIKRSGINTEGMDVYVIPYKDKEGAMAAFVLDPAEGFSFGGFGSLEGLRTPVRNILNSKSMEGVDRVVVSYDAQMQLTAPTHAIRGVVDGTMGRDEFIQHFDAGVSSPAVLKDIPGYLKNLQ